MTKGKFYRMAQAGLLATGLSMAPFYAHAAGVKVGVLSCHEASGWGMIFESTRDLRCVFSPSSGPSAHYTGHISKFGVDIGYQGAGVMIWTVLAPALNMSPGDLAGEYAGVTGGAAVGVGAAANVLVGGSNKSISLQPVSFEGESGLNVAAGIGALALHYEPEQQVAPGQTAQPMPGQPGQ
jgi:hypothetical protein